eukprot:4748146-Pyramimonas_sp.AAC.1
MEESGISVERCSMCSKKSTLREVDVHGLASELCTPSATRGHGQQTPEVAAYAMPTSTAPYGMRRASSTGKATMG